MSQQELPKSEEEAQEVAVNVEKDEVQGHPAGEAGENISNTEEKDTKVEEAALDSAPTEELAENIPLEETSPHEPTDDTLQAETDPNVKRDSAALETSEAKDTSEVQPSEGDAPEQEKVSESAEEQQQAPEGTQEDEPAPESTQEPHSEGIGTPSQEGSAAEQGILLTDENLSFKFEVESQIDPELEDLEAHPLDDLTDQQVIDIVNEVEAENRHLELENILFESFLRDNDPSLLEGIDEILVFLMKRTPLSLGSSREVQDRPSITLDRQKLRLDSYTSITSIAEGKGPKINLSQKTDMVMRAMEEIQASLESFLKKSHIAKRNLKSELEEFSIREAEIKEASDIFEFNVVTQGYDKLTQRIPAEKFVRYMEEWLKSAQLQIEKLRLRIATLKVQYKKVSQQLIQRQELGENVHAVDFDQLEIENKHFIEKIEQKNIHLIELKKMNGGANLVLSTHKKFLQKQQEDCNKLTDEITLKNNLIEATEKECMDAEDELNEIHEKYEHCKNLKNQYTVPDVMEYVRLKGKLYELRKNIKIWIRRRKIQDIALNTCLREMKNLTGNTNIDPKWFEDSKSLDSASSEEMLK